MIWKKDLLVTNEAFIRSTATVSQFRRLVLNLNQSAHFCAPRAKQAQLTPAYRGARHTSESSIMACIRSGLVRLVHAHGPSQIYTSTASGRAERAPTPGKPVGRHVPSSNLKSTPLLRHTSTLQPFNVPSASEKRRNFCRLLPPPERLNSVRYDGSTTGSPPRVYEVQPDAHIRHTRRGGGMCSASSPRP